MRAFLLLSVAVLASIGVGIGVESADSTASSMHVRTVNWSDVTLPGSVCGSAHPITLHRGNAVVTSDRWPTSSPRVEVISWESPIYGNLFGAADNAVAVNVECNNLGGTAAGQLAFASVVFVVTDGSPRALTVLTPPLQSNPDVHIPLFEITSIRSGVVSAEESLYTANSEDCCPTGEHATITWVYKHGQLAHAATVAKKPISN